jgi:hypothetical protein
VASISAFGEYKPLFTVAITPRLTLVSGWGNPSHGVRVGVYAGKVSAALKEGKAQTAVKSGRVKAKIY